MKKETKKVDYDMSVLSLTELIKLYNDIVEFVKLLEDSKIEEEERWVIF